jgi:hypothetical protein
VFETWTTNQRSRQLRRALLPTAILLPTAAGRTPRMVGRAVQIRAGALSNEIESLGGPSAAGIPIVLHVAPPAQPPALAITRSGANLVISWPADATGFTLESAAALPASSWTAVPGVTGNSVTISPAGAASFYRLHQ